MGHNVTVMVAVAGPFLRYCLGFASYENRRWALVLRCFLSCGAYDGIHGAPGNLQCGTARRPLAALGPPLSLLDVGAVVQIPR